MSRCVAIAAERASFVAQIRKQRAEAEVAEAFNPDQPRDADGKFAGGDDGDGATLYHFTSPENAASIRTNGFRASTDGELGQGVYLVPQEKAPEAKQGERISVTVMGKLLNVTDGPNRVLQVMRALYGRTEGNKKYDALPFASVKQKWSDLQQRVADSGYVGIQVHGDSTEPKNTVVFNAAHAKVQAKTSEAFNPDQPRDPDGKFASGDTAVADAGKNDPSRTGNYPLVKTGTKVSGLTVRTAVPNMSSIESTIDDPEILPGIREIPLSDFPSAQGEYKFSNYFYAASDVARADRLADQIKESGEISPLIVVIDREGPYVLEGGHRLAALHKLGKATLPAKVVIDRDDVPVGEAFNPDQPRDPDGKFASGNAQARKGRGPVGPRTGEFVTKLPEGDPTRVRTEAVIAKGKEFVASVTANDSKLAEFQSKLEQVQSKLDKNDKLFAKHDRVLSDFMKKDVDERTAEDRAAVEKSSAAMDRLMIRSGDLEREKADLSRSFASGLGQWVTQGSATGSPDARVKPQFIGGEHPQAMMIGHAMEEFGKATGAYATVDVHTIPADQEQRSYYSSVDQGIHLSANTSVSTVWHELGHWMEGGYSQNGTHQSALAFLEYRTHGEETRPLGTLMAEIGEKTTGYGADESARPDKFLDTYTGKIYPGNRATEVVSMGMQYLAEDAGRFYRMDPDHFHFTVGLIRQYNGY